MPDMLKAALWYSDRGFSVVPGKAHAAKDGKDVAKSPRVEWAPYQANRADAAQIRLWWQQWPDSRVMLVTGKISGITVVDADTPEAIGEIYENLPDQIEMPVALSPRGGRHFYFEYQEGLQTKAGVLPGIDVRNDGGVIMAPPSGSINGKGYSWIEKQKISNARLPSFPDRLLKYLLNKGGSGGVYVGSVITDNHNKSQRSQLITGMIKEGSRDQSLFHIANHLYRGKMSVEEIESLLLLISERCCDPPMPEREVQAKIKSVLDRAQRSGRNIMQEVREWAMITSGHFLITDYHRESQVITSDHKHAVAVAFSRLEKEGIIEKFGNKRGCYRRIEKQTEEIEWWQADCEEISLRLPLGLEEYVKILPKTITVIAGSQDAGKTALLLNFAYDNANKHNIHYFSSEMDANELAIRLGCLTPYKKDVLRKIRFMDRSHSFTDVIAPDAINVIDYFEIGDNFFRIAEEFKSIRDKLNKGIAVIALQKDKGKEYGRGASFSMEKPRLYLSLDRDASYGNVLRVKKAKNWRNTSINPNGLMRKFWIYQGINLSPNGIWEPET